MLGKPEQSGIVIGPGYRPRFASGHLLFVLGGHIQTQPFNPSTFTLSGDPRALGEALTFSVSANGVLAYHESSEESELKIFDRNGNVIATPGPLAVYDGPRFSPDGKSIAVTVLDARSGKNDVWAYPAAGGQPTRITFGPEDYWPVWSPDGKEIAYNVSENGKYSIRRRPLDGHQPEETLYNNKEVYTAVDWSPDGKYLSLERASKEGTISNWILPLAGSREPFRPQAISKMSVSGNDGIFSPDSRWLAYFSYETGRPEILVVPFVSGEAKYQVSTAGGWLPRFSRSHRKSRINMPKLTHQIRSHRPQLRHKAR